ncbi:Putative cytochrome P450 CYP13A5 [Caenorhabditis elegans] [Rhizoctonia solani]|uniref:Putative cytochrome P450 CYP13A5 [Caenorhabditis elegans] n=1 Tax=Rhizoctonia solani TaxID=456999 RepID=A0A0K6GIA9_9AGAM|nr:Putative cytochrome P450 CYP13A5 [Caenorhabditis elegans] [Rhizoctonia solani]
MSTIADNLVDIITSQIQANGTNIEVVDIFKWVNLVALEIIGQAGMGHSFGVLEGKVPDYLGASRDMFPLMMEMWYLQPFLPAMSRVGPPSLRRFVVERIAHRPVQAMKNVVDTMNKTAVEIMRRKRAALENGTLDSEVASGQDIMTALLRQNRVVVSNDQMTDEEILAQVNGLAFAGHDTTSSALSRTISVLSEHQEIQDVLRSEIREAYRLHGKNLNYDQLNSLSYLDAVCRETLRLYAPATFVNRVATKDWTVPLQYPARSEDGKITISSIHIPKDTDIRISLRAANRDKQTWGNDAEEFRPSRWLEPLPKSVTDSRMPGIFSSTMTFLGGPRACPGMKFSQLEMSMKSHSYTKKTGSNFSIYVEIILSTLVSSFKFEPSKHKIKWKNDGIVKPYVQHQDGTTSEVPTMPVQVTILGGSE